MRKKIIIRSHYMGVLLIAISLLLSCQKDDDSTPLVQFGSIEGFAKIHTTGGNLLFTGGMTVSIIDSEPLLSAQTVENGFYLFENIPYGRYDLHFEKDGFGTYIRTDVIHNATQSILEPRDFLSQQSPTEISDVNFILNDDGVTIETFTSPPANGFNIKFIRLFFNNASDVSSEVYKYFTAMLIANSFPESTDFTFSKLIELGFDPGSTIYVRAYADSFYSNTYREPNSGADVFPNLNPVSIGTVSFVLP